MEQHPVFREAAELPNEREPLFLGQVIDRDLFQHSGRNALPRPEHIYLESDLDLLGEGALREHGLNLGHDGAVDDAA